MNMQHSLRCSLNFFVKSNCKQNILFNLNNPKPLLGLNQTRNTHVVEHYKPQELLDWKPDGPDDPQTWHTRSDPRYIYKDLYDTNRKKPVPIKVLLLTTVSGLGNKGAIVSLPPTKARKNLLLPKLAVYASPENIEKYKDCSINSTDGQPSSFSVPKTVNHLGGLLLWVSMNIEEKWELQPWHMRVALRKAGIICSEEAIELPSEPIRGPNMDLQQKAFYVTITINKKEKVRVRCLISHVTADLTKKLPYINVNPEEPLDPIFAEQADYLNALYNQRIPLTPYNHEPQITPEMVVKLTSAPETTK